MMRKARGVTLIELMISMAIGLILAAAASYMFLTSQRIYKTIDTRGQQQETAAIVLDFIGRDLKNAGFYPATFPTTAAVPGFYGQYSNIVPSTPVAYNQGVFGCSNAVFNPYASPPACPAAVSGAPDSLVVNYFSSDDFTVEGVGSRSDCLRGSVNTVTYNISRAGVGATNTTTVALPVFITNIYSLGSTTTLALDKQSVNTRSFRCAGNSSSGNHRPLFSGVEELRLRYGVSDGTTIEAPARFHTAAEVSALSALVVGGVSKTGWQRVVSVQVCIVTKTLDNSVRQTATGTYLNCDNTTVNYTTADRSIYQRSIRTFGLRNNLTGTF